MRILIVLTSHGELGQTSRKTCLWLEALAAPYYLFEDAGVDLTLASPLGGQPPLDPASDVSDATRRFEADPAALAALATTLKLAVIDPATYDAVFYPCGQGPPWDLAEDETSIAFFEALEAAGKPVAMVAHARGVLQNVTANDSPARVARKRVAVFSGSEEAAVWLLDAVPFKVRDMLREAGGIYSKGPDWAYKW